MSVRRRKFTMKAHTAEAATVKKLFVPVIDGGIGAVLPNGVGLVTIQAIGTDDVEWATSDPAGSAPTTGNMAVIPAANKDGAELSWPRTQLLDIYVHALGGSNQKIMVICESIETV